MEKEPSMLDLDALFPELKVKKSELVFWKHRETREMAELIKDVQALPNVEVKSYSFIDHRNDFLTSIKLMNESSDKAIHVFTGYLESELMRKLMLVAGARHQRVIVIDGSPVASGFFGKFYEKNILPGKVQLAVQAADLLVFTSPESEIPTVYPFGWDKDKIVPFTTAAAFLEAAVGNGEEQNQVR